LRQITAVRRGRSKMENINGKSRASFRWMLSFATVGLVISISPCFAQGNDRDASQEMQGLGTVLPEITPFKCDSLDPKVCFDIYSRLHNEPAPPSLDRRFLPQSPNWSFAPNWSTKFEDLHYNLGTGLLGTVPFTFSTPGINNFIFR
jgi:hypothetical protein